MMPSLIETAVRSLLLAFAVGAGLRVFRVRNVLAQKFAWGLVLAAVFLMPFVMQWRSLLPGVAVKLPAEPMAMLKAALPSAQPFNAPPAQKATERASSLIAAPKRSASISRSLPADARDASLANFSDFDAPSRVAIPSSSPAAVISDVYHGAPVSTDPAPPAPHRKQISWASIAWLLYLGVAGSLLGRLFYGLASAVHMWESAKPISRDDLPGFATGLPLRVSRAVPSPVTIGSGILLPVDHNEWDVEKLRIVLAHERSHIRQGDFYLQLLAGFYAALVWFSPLGWWLKRKLSDLGETISDRAGLEQAQNGASYAQILLEFAAAPRATSIGVAMARQGSLSGRIERLLNDRAFRQAFSGGRGRVLIAVLMVPVALYAATALVRVQAAQTPQSAPAPSAAPVARPAQASAAAAAASADSQADETPSAETMSSQADGPVVVAPVAPVAPTAPVIRVVPMAPVAPMAPVVRVAPVAPVTPAAPVAPVAPFVTIDPGSIRMMARDGRVFAFAQAQAQAQAQADDSGRHNYHYHYSNDGDSYGIVRGEHRDMMTFSGDMHTVDVDKARKLAHGDFLWFEHDDKLYFVDDPAIMAQIETMYKPIEELGKQQEELGKQQEELGRQQEALGRQQEEATVPAPDMQKEIAAVDAAMSKIREKMGKNVTQEELADLEGKLGDLQGRLGDLQGKIGDVQGKLGDEQGKLGAAQGRLGAQQGRLGAEQGRLSRDADRKVRSIIEESLQNGKAHPVE